MYLNKYNMFITDFKDGETTNMPSPLVLIK